MVDTYPENHLRSAGQYTEIRSRVRSDAKEAVAREAIVEESNGREVVASTRNGFARRFFKPYLYLCYPEMIPVLTD